MGYGTGPTKGSNTQNLTDSEIDDFINSLDKDNNGHIEYSELEWKLDQVHKEIAPKPLPHHLNHQDRDDTARHTFLRSLIGTEKDTIPVAEFRNVVQKWKIPSFEQDKQAAKDEEEYLKRLKPLRRLRLMWAVKGPEMVFIGLVVGLQLAFAIWQCVKYVTQTQYRAAFGWGVVLAKTSAGALYPTFFLLQISMSRYLSTFLRKNYYISRVVNWDVSQSFHIKMALALATLHAIGHLTGSFYFGSRPDRQDSVAVILGADTVPRRYVDYVRSLPGATGIGALSCFYLIAGLSTKRLRKFNYEGFQVGHLLMFPMIGMLAAHGTQALLQSPMLGYWIAVPSVLIIMERLLRVLQGFHHIDATLDVLDDETVCVTTTIPHYRPWPYKAGQYIFLQVPSISFFQWHPFTISTCTGSKMQVHVKNDGNWANKLYEMGKKGETISLKVGVDGPFGAPAQRFRDFDISMVVGAGIGVTPFSGILHDTLHNESRRHDKQSLPDSKPITDEKPQTTRADSSGTDSSLSTSPTLHRNSNSNSSSPSNPSPLTAAGVKTDNEKHLTTSPPPPPSSSASYRRIDFHWLVRDRTNLLWFSELLNSITSLQAHTPHLDVNVFTHVSRKHKDISTHIFRWLLELHRTEEHPASSVTGLLNPTQFGRPDFGAVMQAHYGDVVKIKAARRRGRSGSGSDGEGEGSAANASDDDDITVGVFFCGPPVIGYQLADWCWRLTAKGREDGSRIEYRFMMEVFN